MDRVRVEEIRHGLNEHSASGTTFTSLVNVAECVSFLYFFVQMFGDCPSPLFPPVNSLTLLLSLCSFDRIRSAEA